MANARETTRLTLEILRWELDRAFAGIHSVFQRMAIVFAAISITSAFLPGIFISENSNIEFSNLRFIIFLLGVLILAYAGYLSLKAMWGKNTAVRESLGTQILKDEILHLDKTDAESELIDKFSYLVDVNQVDLISRRNLMNGAMASMAIAYLLIGVSLWYSIDIGFNWHLANIGKFS